MFFKLSIIFFTSCLVVNVRGETDKAAQKLLKGYDLDELVDKLSEFDLDQDGQLSEMEVQLQQPGIQKYLDRYAELLKEAEEEEEEEEEEKEHAGDKVSKKVTESAQKTARPQSTSSSGPTERKNNDQEVKEQKNQKQQTPTPSNNAVEDEDDGVEIETVEELNIVEDDGSDSSSITSIPFIAGAAVGVLAILVSVLFMRTKVAQQTKRLQREEEIRLKRLSRFGVMSNNSSKPQPQMDSSAQSTDKKRMAEQREAWLNRIASSQQQKTTEKTNPSPVSLSSSSSPKPALNSHDNVPPVSPLTKGLAEKLVLSPKPDCSGDRSDHTPPGGRQLTDVSNTVAVNCDSGELPAKQQRITITKSSVKSEPKVKRTLNKFVDSNTEAPKPQPQPEKTTDLEKLKAFFEKAFDCILTLSDELSRMRFSGGKMRVPTEDFPSSLDDLEKKMALLVQQAFAKQVNKVKFSVKAYNTSDSEGSTFHDKMVDAAADVIKIQAINALITHFQEENLNSSQDSGLWESSDTGFETNVFQYETYNFLPRLIGNASDGVNISQSMLSQLLTHEKADCMISSLLHAGGSRCLAAKRMDEIMLGEGATIQALEMLVSSPQFGDALARILSKEIDEAMKHSLGNYFQERAALCELLSVSTLPGNTSGRHSFLPSEAAQGPFRNLRSFPRLTLSDINTAQGMIQKGIRQLHQLVYVALKRVVINKSTREVGLSWISTLIGLNELRMTSIMQDNNDVQPVCSDGFMLNLCSVLLEFCLPICQSLDKLNKVDLGYSASPACRLIYDFEPCLGAGQLVTGKDKEKKMGMLPPELQGQHSFITECFHLTQRALSVSIIPALKHYNKMNNHFATQTEQAKGTDKEEAAHDQHVLVTSVWDTSLMDSDLVHGITVFYISQARLMLNVVDSLAEKYKNPGEAQKAQKKAVSVIPEFCVKDMAQWFTFLAFNVLRVHPNATQGIALTPFVDCCVMLLERPDLMPGPVPASMIVTALLAFMKNSDSDDSARFGRHSGWGSGIMSDLAAMVHTCPSAQTKLGPALLRTYVSVDVVEGLDVDKDNFDKFNTRVQISQLVQKLWSRTDCRASIINQCGTDMFQSFLDSILDTLLYKLHDSLGRLANVKKIETLKANDVEWNALSKRQQAEKDVFLRNEEHVGSGFMRQAKKTLKFLNLISQSEKVAQCFTRQPLATRAASTINGFLDSLCGAKAKTFKVKDMAKYDFNPVELLLDIVNIILRIAVEDVSHTDGYMVSMVKDPDFELANMEKAQSVIVNKGFVAEDTVDKVTQLMDQLRALAAEHCPQSASSVTDDNNWRDAFVDLDIDQGELEKQYVAAMADERFNMVRIQESHCFINNMQDALDSRSPKVKVLLKEMQQLTTSLPVHADASIFVRQDKDRMDVMRAMLIGPTGTPYSLGCFCFDVYFPTSYPNVPPLVKIITTGNGTVRFNPNLYADGKVCLSLLGTWHAGVASEKWTPGKSSLYQVLVSIQSMILTPDPVFNEPGYERIRDTDEGEIQSRQYNWKIHLQTLRHAILGQLRNPPAGFQRLIRRHFALQREAVLKQCAAWVKECEDPDLLKHLRRAADSIFEEIMNLDVDFDEEEMDSEDDEEEDDD